MSMNSKSFNNFAAGLSFKKSLLKDYLRSQIPLPFKVKLNEPIFVIGSSRSGTTLLSDLLSVFPELCNFTENNLVRRHMWKMIKRPESISYELLNLEKTLVRLSGVSFDKRLLEKSPGHSLLAKPLADYFPDAKFVHILRDPRDVAASMLQHHWIFDELRGIHDVFWMRFLPDEFQDEWSNLTIWKRAILRWAVYAKSARAIESYDGRYFEIKYEDVCKLPEKSFQNLLTFLGLEFDNPDFKRQLTKIKPQNADRWQKKQLDPEQLKFLRRVFSTFEINHIK